MENFLFKKYLQIFGCFCLLGVLLSCQANTPKSATETSEAEEQKVEPPQKKVIVFFGNSLTAGYGLEDGESFPSLIQKRLDSLSLPYQVVNAGISGETSAGGLSRIDWTLNQPVDVFILELGANDALRGFDLNATAGNLQGIIDQVQTKSKDIDIILAGMKAPPNMGATYSNQFEQIYVELSEQNELPLIPFLLEGVAGNPELNLPDGIHPNPEGQKILVENVWTVLKEVL